MAKDDSERGFIDMIKEDRYVLIVAVAILIFIASSSIALFSENEYVEPVPGVNATVKGGMVSLVWQASPSPVSGYDIYRSSEEGVLGKKLNSAPIAGHTYSEQLSPGDYYYTVRATSGNLDDGNTRQLKVRVGLVVPTGVSLKINDGADYSNSQSVTLTISATNAKECRFRNDLDSEWSAWETYKETKAWILSAGADGRREVGVQCRNTGESAAVSASVILDRTAPQLSYSSSFEGGVFSMELGITESVSPSVSCTITRDGVAQGATIAMSGGHATYLYSTTFQPGTHSVSVECSDEAGNTVAVPAETISN